VRVRRRRRWFPDSDAALRSQSYRFSTSYRRLARSQKQVSFPKRTSPTKDGARSRRLDRPAQPMQTTLRSRRENSLRQGSYSLIFSMRTTVSSSPLLSLPLRSSFSTSQAREILMEESNVQPVRCPVTVCGDIHGQFVRSYPCSTPTRLSSSPLNVDPLRVPLPPLPPF
jgi:hypothetical protein